MSLVSAAAARDQECLIPDRTRYTSRGIGLYKGDGSYHLGTIFEVKKVPTASVRNDEDSAAVKTRFTKFMLFDTPAPNITPDRQFCMEHDILPEDEALPILNLADQPAGGTVEINVNMMVLVKIPGSQYVPAKISEAVLRPNGKEYLWRIQSLGGLHKGPKIKTTSPFQRKDFHPLYKGSALRLVGYGKDFRPYFPAKVAGDRILPALLDRVRLVNPPLPGRAKAAPQRAQPAAQANQPSVQLTAGPPAPSAAQSASPQTTATRTHRKQNVQRRKAALNIRQGAGPSAAKSTASTRTPRTVTENIDDGAPSKYIDSQVPRFTSTMKIHFASPQRWSHQDNKERQSLLHEWKATYENEDKASGIDINELEHHHFIFYWTQLALAHNKLSAGSDLTVAANSQWAQYKLLPPDATVQEFREADWPQCAENTCPNFLIGDELAKGWCADHPAGSSADRAIALD